MNIQIENKHWQLTDYKRYVPQLILEGLRGSQSHGTFDPGHPDSIDDIDYMGIAVMPPVYYTGLRQFETAEIKDGPYDIVVYEVRKFIRLLVKANPNVLVLLWLRPEDYTFINPQGRMLLDNRMLFSTQAVYQSFVGYAKGQLYKMTHLACEGYMGEKRKALVQKYGYDTKNAAHCIRILRMGIEFLQTGEFQVWRQDRDELLEIKHGEWSIEKVTTEVDRLLPIAEQAHAECKLPQGPVDSKVNQLCHEIVSSFHGFLPTEGEKVLP